MTDQRTDLLQFLFEAYQKTGYPFQVFIAARTELEDPAIVESLAACGTKAGLEELFKDLLDKQFVLELQRSFQLEEVHPVQIELAETLFSRHLGAVGLASNSNADSVRRNVDGTIKRLLKSGQIQFAEGESLTDFVGELVDRELDLCRRETRSMIFRTVSADVPSFDVGRTEDRRFLENLRRATGDREIRIFIDREIDKKSYVQLAEDYLLSGPARANELIKIGKQKAQLERCKTDKI